MKPINTFSVKTDVTNIEIDAVHADVTVIQATDGTFKVEYPASKNISVGSSQDCVILSQSKFPLSRWRTQSICVHVPSHTVPNIKIHAKNCNLTVQGGIYGELACTLGDGTVKLFDALFSSVEVAGDGADFRASGITVKNNVYLQLEKGNVLAEHTFATRTDCKVKRGNVGLVAVSCKECALNTYRGNVTATLVGSEGEYSTTLITREGTVNREGVNREGAGKSFLAYAEKGNIVLEFAERSVPLPQTDEHEADGGKASGGKASGAGTDDNGTDGASGKKDGKGESNAADTESAI